MRGARRSIRGLRVRPAYTALADAVNVTAGGPDKNLRCRHPCRRGYAQPGRRCGIQGDRPHPGQGQGEAIAIYEPLEKESAEPESWGEALRAYRAQQSDAAEAVLQRLQRADPAIGRRLKCAFVCSVAREGSADAICAQRPSFSTATF